MEEHSSEPQKRGASPSKKGQTPPNKKVRLGFSGKEFRKDIKTMQKTQALQGFLQLLNEGTNEEVILTYLQQGGSPLEILQTMEGESGTLPVLVFEIVNKILLQIGAKLPQHQNSAYDASRYLLNTYIQQINKMLGLSSSMKERIVTLRLLTTIVTFSVMLAKDVLLNVNFNPTNLEILTKCSEGKNEAREAFIHFITAFLVNGHFPTLSVLLEKRGLMTSIIRGLQYDEADVVVLILTALKDQILENGFVSKTLKMKTFSTPVVKDIVNLYNWKGPAGLVDQKKKTKLILVDEIDKSKVNEAVHSFLLVLCTSHKYGVVFKDPMIGLGKRQNSLMLTVLESLERPWEHSYAGELVVQICRACPDLAKMMWMNLKPSLVPRWTNKWLKAVEFVLRILDEFLPECVEFALDNLNLQQVVQIMTILTSPLPVIKVLIPEDHVFDQPATKHQVMGVFLKMAVKLNFFLTQSKNWKAVDYDILKRALANHVLKNFPDVEFILKEWDKSDDHLCVSDYVEVVLDLLGIYKFLAPEMLEELQINFDIHGFIKKLETTVDKRHLKTLKVKAVEFFMNLEPSLFKPTSDLFRNSVSAAMQLYYETSDEKVLKVLHQLLKNSGVFDGFSTEINFWINGILNLKSYDDIVATILCDLIQKTDENAAEFHQKLFGLKGANFSSMLLSLNEIEVTKTLKSYLNFVLLNIFHVQIDYSFFIENFPKSQLGDNVFNYISSWKNLEGVVLGKCKGKLMEQFHIFSQSFLHNDLQIEIENFYPDCRLNLLQMIIFYLTNLIKTGSLKDRHEKNCWKFLDILFSENTFDNERYVETILGNPVLLENFTLFDIDDFSTKLILHVVKNVKKSVLEDYLIEFRKKIVSVISKLLRKPEKYQNLNVSIMALELITLDYKQCKKLIEKFVTSENRKNFWQVAAYCLNQLTELGYNYDMEPLDLNIINELTQIAKILNEKFPFIASLHSYLKVFPHSLEIVENSLFKSLVLTSEFNKENLSLCEFLLKRKPECWSFFEENLNEICSKRSFILFLLDVVVERYEHDDTILEKIFDNIKPHIVKALQKPNKAGQHFSNRYHSLGILVEKFMKADGFANGIQKFETTELFHVYLLKKIYDKIEKTSKNLGNMIMTFVHLLTSLLKQKEVKNLKEVGTIIFNFLLAIKDVDLTSLSSNEFFKNFCKLCLKFGVSGDFVLIQILTELVRLCVMEEDGKLILEMLLSHSQFLDVILGESRKVELLELWTTLCTKWPQFMERNHIPVLLSAYRGTKSDSVALNLLKMYESNPSQTKFFDFKPFLWGRAASSHYSVRNDIQKALWRQPKMVDVLNSLNPNTIAATVANPSDPNSYDLDYFLPLFSHLLSPENPVPTYRFTKSGALALTLTGFRGDKSQRLATCHVLQRFYFHLEARQSGKDNLLWLRFIEAICKGVAVFEDFEINNFVGVFLARTALVMTQPMDLMYVPLTQYLAAKETLDFSTIPELYTFLHSSQIESKEHRHFILQIIQDGLKCEKDFTAFLRCMAFKLISELCSSSVCDTDTKLLILEVFQICCKMNFAIKILCNNLSFLSQIFSLILNNAHEEKVLLKLLKILSSIVEVDTDLNRNFTVYVNLIALIENSEYCRYLSDSRGIEIYCNALMRIVNRFPIFFREEHITILLEKIGDPLCKYLLRFGCLFVREEDLKDESLQCLRLLFYNKLKMR